MKKVIDFGFHRASVGDIRLLDGSVMAEDDFKKKHISRTPRPRFYRNKSKNVLPDEDKYKKCTILFKNIVFFILFIFTKNT